MTRHAVAACATVAHAAGAAWAIARACAAHLADAVICEAVVNCCRKLPVPLLVHVNAAGDEVGDSLFVRGVGCGEAVVEAANHRLVGVDEVHNHHLGVGANLVVANRRHLCEFNKTVRRVDANLQHVFSKRVDCTVHVGVNLTEELMKHRKLHALDVPVMSLRLKRQNNAVAEALGEALGDVALCNSN